MLRQRARQFVAALLVGLGLPAQQGVVVAQRNEKRKRALDVGRRVAQHEPAQRAQFAGQFARGHDVTDAQAGREGLGQAADVDDAAVAVQALERGDGAFAPAAFAFEVILDDHAVGLARQRQQALAPFHRERDRRGALVAGGDEEIIAA
ncbi:hypothetical protein D9M68_679930 [compost metagenome]